MPRLTGPLARDLGVVLGWFVALGVLAAVVWWQLTPLAEYTRTATNAEMGEEELGRQVSADGWYVVIAAVGGLLSGVGLLSIRKRDPLAMVVLVTLGSLLCAWVMLRVGLWLGPADPKSALPHAAVGAKVPMQLKPHASGVVYVWPITALLGAIGVVWGTDDRRPATASGDQEGRGVTAAGDSSDDALSVDQPG
jgi:hypothetical protein